MTEIALELSNRENMQNQQNIGDEFEANISQNDQDRNAAERPRDIREPIGEGRSNVVPENKESEPHDNQNTMPREARVDESQFPREQRQDNQANRVDPAQQSIRNPQNNEDEGGYGRGQRQQWRDDQR